MRRLRSLAVDARTPVGALLLSVFVAGAVVAGIGIAALTLMGERSRSALDQSQAALLASRTSESAIRVQATTHIHDDKLDSAAILAAYIELEDAHHHVEQLHVLVGSMATLEAYSAVLDAQEALAAYAEAEDGEGEQAFQASVDNLGRIVGELVPVLSSSAEQEQASLQRVKDRALTATILASVIGALVVGSTSIAIGRRLLAALRALRTENAALAEAKGSVERRNGQFEALYQVMAEVSETLSMKYVVQTTLRESRHLVGAEAAILRLLRDGRLEVVGTEQSGDFDLGHLSPLELGEGVVGRAARRGKAIRIDEEAAAHLAAGEGIPEARSGIIVPLIVGARVVGTLACWAREPGMFGDEDERVLTMMASQVATAVAAADTHETTRHEANHDVLTGLPNRRQMEADIRSIFDEKLATGGTLAVAMLDVDHFKRFNDEFGHRAGDITLERVAGVLRTALRSHDRVYRYGGEEFAVVLEDLDGEGARHLLDRLRAAVARTPLVGENLEPIGNVTISGGVACAPADGSGFEELLQLADLALYESKRAGRNRITAHALTEGSIELAA